MYDRDLAVELLTQIHKAALKVLRRFEPIQSPNDFVLSESGLEKFDGPKDVLPMHRPAINGTL